MATISIIQRTDKKKSDGTMPLHFLIIKDRKKSKITTGISIDPKYWDAKKGKVKPGATNSARLNANLQEDLAKLSAKILEVEGTVRSVTTKQLKEKIRGIKPSSFFAFAENANEQYKEAGQVASYKKNKYIIAKLKEFVGDGTFDFQDITPDFLRKYETYLRTKQNNAVNTIHKDFRYIRKLFNDAYRNDIIEHHQIPFNKYKLKMEKTTREYLSEEELIKIEECQFTLDSKMDLHRDMFIFSSYTGGLRVSDILLLKWSSFDETHINFTVKKTGSQLAIKLPSKAIEIINKYKPGKPNRNDFIFPMLNNSLNLKDPEAVLTAVSSATAYINKNLKTITEKAKVEKQISFHISRHTWATRALRKGISIDKVSKIMGHAQIRETQIYAKIVNSELDKAMDVFNV